jgi:hypothetical protein
MPTRKRFGPAPPLPFRKLELSPSRLPLVPICSANEFPILHRQSCKRWGCSTLSYESPGSIGGVGKARGHEAVGFLGEEH